MVWWNILTFWFGLFLGYLVTKRDYERVLGAYKDYAKALERLVEKGK